MKKIGQELTQSKTSVFLFTFLVCTIVNILIQRTLMVSDLIGIFVETIVIAFGIWQVRKIKSYDR
ncbi:hypothetical protein A5881_000368 [Enterococcus termitis]